MTTRRIWRRAIALAIVALLGAPALARAEHVFLDGRFAGVTGQGGQLSFWADHGGVHVFRARLRLACADGTKRTVRVSVPHVEDLEGDTGRFRFVRRAGARSFLRLTGTLAGEDARGTLSKRRGGCESGTRRWTAERRGGGHHHPPAEGEDGHGHGTSPTTHVGSRAPYPAPERASAANRRRAERLRQATNREAFRFGTAAMAERAGYVADPAITPVYRPGLVHYRKHGANFWGRVLEPSRPQALIFWCPSSGECALAAFMYRAPPKPLPPTYGNILGWHRHGDHGSWMTHLWLTDGLATSYAQCAPFGALASHNPLVSYERYRPDVPGVDEPCG